MTNSKILILTADGMWKILRWGNNESIMSESNHNRVGLIDTIDTICYDRLINLN